MTEKQEKLQKLYVEFQVLNNSIKQLEKQNEALETQLMELMVTNQSLDDMKKVESGTEILVPISSGIYVKAEIKDTDSFTVNVGSNIALSKDLNFTKKIIENQIDEIKKLQENFVNELQSNTSKAGLLEKEITEIASTLENK